MSSTNGTESKIKALFEGMIIGNPKNYLATAIDKSADSYYESPKHPAQAYFSFIETGSEDSLAAYFNTFWTELGSKEFTTMSKELSELAFLLSAGHETQSGDVSPFVYTMY